MEKQRQLEEYLRGLQRGVVAFSGGVDSALLAFLARKILGRDNVVAVTGDSVSIPSRDRGFVKEFCQENDIPHQFVKTYEYAHPQYRSNPENRCFFCKQELYQRLKEYAQREGYPYIIDGTHVDDLKGDRPGFQALQEAGVKVPYVDCQIGKQTIREIAAIHQLKVATKPQAACLASRIPTGTAIDREALCQVDQAENALKELGFQNPRVRFHEKLARLQFKEEEWALCLEKRREIRNLLKQIGFEFIALDLKEYDREG